MKILLYEPGLTGHRDVILGYVRVVLDKAGVQYELLTRTLRPISRVPVILRTEAHRTGCNLIHVLTIDGLAAGFLRSSFRIMGPNIPIVGTYYLFNNLMHTFRGMAWDWLHASGQVQRLLISDSETIRCHLPGWRRDYVGFLPDPWSPSNFQVIRQDDARRKLGLPSKGLLLLLFGLIGPKKGVLETVRAFVAADLPAEARLLIAGKFELGVLDQIYAIAGSAELVAGEKILLRPDYIRDADVSRYFYACDYVLCIYSPSFTVSSGTMTLACAAGRAIIATDHGVIGRDVLRRQLGLVFRAGDLRSFVAVLQEACRCRQTSLYERWQTQGGLVALERTIERYGHNLLSGYRVALASRQSDL